ncbi:MAG: hypothetical protein L0Z49_00695 [Actinobacteria bacterium]|nr:hypothetical protein [Actinomycetota bacterium]
MALTGVTHLPEGISEADLTWSSGYAMVRGWRVCHFRPATTRDGWRTAVQGHPGFPDLVLARRGRVVFAELKAALSAEQLEWLDASHHHPRRRGISIPPLLCVEIVEVLS